MWKAIQSTQWLEPGATSHNAATFSFPEPFPPSREGEDHSWDATEESTNHYEDEDLLHSNKTDHHEHRRRHSGKKSTHKSTKHGKKKKKTPSMEELQDIQIVDAVFMDEDEEPPV
uniref:Uncharacterized protein n=1 Tax=Entomoneis paludosa TaxID=265537 RepID=A0A7S2YA40_9STRA